MEKIIIIADDLTGANATGVLLAKDRRKTATVTSMADDTLNDYDVVALTTNSRSISEAEAYNAVSEKVKAFTGQNISFFNKRIDSTLRGNIGIEIDAMLDNLPEHIAVVVASYPASQRVCIGGFLMVGNIPLERTSIAQDPKNPINTSVVTDIIGKQTKRQVGYISLKAVLKGIDAIKEELEIFKNKDIRVIVIDATTDEDIQKIAGACVALKLKTVTVDPGPFTYYYAKESQSTPAGHLGKKVIATIGSVSELTRRQIQELGLNNNAYIIKADSDKLLSNNERDTEIARIISKVKAKIDNYEVFAVVTTTTADDVIDLKQRAEQLGTSLDNVSIIINEALAEITYRILTESEDKIGGVYTSGGDVTVAFCERVGTKGVEVKDDVIPLAVYGRLIGGEMNAFPLITKGGMIGDDMTLVRCIDYLLTKISTI